MLRLVNVRSVYGKIVYVKLVYVKIASNLCYATLGYANLLYRVIFKSRFCLKCSPKQNKEQQKDNFNIY